MQLTGWLLSYKAFVESCTGAHTGGPTACPVTWHPHKTSAFWAGRPADAQLGCILDALVATLRETDEKVPLLLKQPVTCLGCRIALPL